MTALRSLVARPDDAVTTRWLRGAELAAHVTRGLATRATAAQVAQGAGYSVARCTQRLAEARHAPLARALLAHDFTDRNRAQQDAEIDAQWEAWKAEPERMRERPRMTPEELLDELSDMAACGMDFGEVSVYYGVSPDALRRRIRSARLRDEARELFPDRFKRTANDMAVA